MPEQHLRIPAKKGKQKDEFGALGKSEILREII
jgi:hypothetical protein